ncbi:hypothetical protein [Variovorax sp. dw_954]|uniref:hypothetical protein n=1 Tax=Variovorax sp. dw_954 TaxID=2720078 RepID=UPI001BD399AD|nr:hypothetical protein [Variovorax sp. dw_954]
MSPNPPDDSPLAWLADARDEVARQCDLLNRLVHRVADEGVAPDELRATLLRLTRAFRAALASLCDRHVRFERTELLPMAGRLLGDDALAHMKKSMRSRRGAHTAHHFFG